MKNRRMLGGLGVLMGFVLTVSGCGGSDDNASGEVAEDCTPAHSDLKTVADGKLTVSTYVSPPYTSLDSAGGELGGIDGEIVNAIAEKECLQVNAAPVTGAAFTEGVSTGRSDIVIGGVYSTPERASEFTLTDAMYRDGMAFLSKDGAASVDDMQGKKLGVIQGYLWTEDLQKVLGKDSVTIYQDGDSMVADLDVDRIDAATFTTAEAGYRAEQVDGFEVAAVEPTPDVAASEGNSEVVILLAKESTDLADALNEDIAGLLEDGTLAGILEDNGIDPELAGAES